MQPDQTRLPPIWLMGFLGTLPVGVFGAILLMTLPQLLAANHVPEPEIAAVTAAGLMPGFGTFLISPLLDWRFSRRIYAIFFLLMAGIAQLAALLMLDNIALLTVLMVTAQVGVGMNQSAMGGWMGTLVSQDDKAKLGAWYSVANALGFGVLAVLAIALLRNLPFALGALILSLLGLLPLPFYFLLPSKPADSKLASESFGQFFRDLGNLLTQREILWTLFLFVMPAASFALTNTLGGLGNDYGASETLVSIIGGIGVTSAGVVGSLIVPPILKHVPPLALYLLVGATGALFTLLSIGLPATPVMFAVALVGQNLFQSAAFSVQYTINLQTIGHDNAFAATQYSLIIASTALPLTYMQIIDGQAYGAGGLSGMLAADGGLTLAASSLLAALMWWRARRRLEGPVEPLETPS